LDWFEEMVKCDEELPPSEQRSTNWNTSEPKASERPSGLNLTSFFLSGLGSGDGIGRIQRSLNLAPNWRVK